MTDKQPEALRIADAFGIPHWTGLPIALHVEAAAELRRLHEVNAELVRVMHDLACWNDGPVGTHMDEPHAAFMARCALAFVESKATGDEP